MLPKIYGLTCDDSGRALVRVPKVVKVGIGAPKGPDISVWIDAEGNWKVSCNTSLGAGKGMNAYRGKVRAEAEQAYRVLLNSFNAEKAPWPQWPLVVKRNMPSKLPYFTFTKLNADGQYEPDFEAIEAHGHNPTEIEIVFTDDEAFQLAFQLWSQTELRCTGDGKDAMRSVKWGEGAAGYEQVAAESKAAGQKMFPIIGGCYTMGCKFALPSKNKKGFEVGPACKPHGRLTFQLIFRLTLGGVAQFDTTSFRSSNQLFSCIHQFLSFTGGGIPERGHIAGIPLRLVLRPFKTEHGKSYAVSLEFRAESIEALKKRIMEAAKSFRTSIDVPSEPAVPSQAKMISAPDAAEAARFVDEFHPDAEEEPAAAEGAIAKTTATATEALAAKLNSVRASLTPAPAPVVPGPPLPIIEAEYIELGNDWNDPDEPATVATNAPVTVTTAEPALTEDEMRETQRKHLEAEATKAVKRGKS